MKLKIKNKPKKFIYDQSYGEEPYDDLNNCLDDHRLKTKANVKEIIAEVPGENDDYAWWWILKLDNDKFMLLSAWCDYTGWGCRSGINVEEVFDSPEAAAKKAPKIEQHRKIQDNLLRQLNNEQVFGTYRKLKDK